MKTLIFPLIIIAMSAVGLPGLLYSAEQTPTGRDILRDCSMALHMSQDGYFENLERIGKPLPTQAQQRQAIQCVSYVYGFKDALYVGEIYREKSSMKPLVCLPTINIKNEEALQIVLKYLKDNPKMLDAPQSAAVFNAFYYAFPCKK